MRKPAKSNTKTCEESEAESMFEDDECESASEAFESDSDNDHTTDESEADCPEQDTDEEADIKQTLIKNGQTQKSPSKIGGLHPFVKGHPLCETHGIRYIPNKDTVIANFIGETLPRRDRGDREWYCSTMLVLFKPWRSGLQLKTQDQSWDDAFESHHFLQQHVVMMDNFNLRYECLDARGIRKNPSCQIFIIPANGDNFSNCDNFCFIIV